MRFAQEISVFNPFAIEKAVIGLNTSITQTSQRISLQAEQIAVIDGKVETATGELSVMAEQIASKVDNSTFTSAINQTAHTISMSVSGKAGKTSGAGITITLKDANGRTLSTGSGSILIDGNVVFSSQLTDGTTTISGSNITTGTINASRVTVTNINASNITTGTISADRIGANSISVGKLTGSISNGNWKIDLNAGTFTIGNISANNINTGTLTGITVSGGEIKQTVTGANTGGYGGNSNGTQASIKNGIVTAGMFRIYTNTSATKYVDIVPEGDDDSDTIVRGYNGIRVNGHLSTWGNIWCGSGGEDDYRLDRFVLNARGRIWCRKLYALDGDEWVSDRREKQDIKYLNHSESKKFIMGLKPASFRMIKSPKKVHHGFIAQDVETVIYDDNWDVVDEIKMPDSKDTTKTLSYTEIIADIVAVLQEHERRLNG